LKNNLSGFAVVVVKLYCADCGKKLWFNIKHGKEDIPFFMCGNYHGNRGTRSSTHYLRADAIE